VVYNGILDQNFFEKKRIHKMLITPLAKASGQEYF